MEESFEITKKIRDWMLKNNKDEFTHNNGRIIFNKYHSPDGALGMFLLLKKSIFKLGAMSDLEREVVDLLTFSTSLENITNNTASVRLQDKFEDYTEILLRNKYNENVKKTDHLHINEYDFEILSIKIETKSDKWKNTGNISLELLRNYLQSHPENIGSILKTRCTFWQIYYYDLSTGDVVSSMYQTAQLQKETSNYLLELSKYLKF